jgi:hypothetical protein
VLLNDYPQFLGSTERLLAAGSRILADAYRTSMRTSLATVKTKNQGLAHIH